MAAPVFWDVLDVRVGQRRRVVAIGRSSEGEPSGAIGMFWADSVGVLGALFDSPVDMECPVALDLGGAMEEGSLVCLATCSGFATLHSPSLSVSHFEPVENARAVFVANTINRAGQVYVATDTGVEYFEAGGGYDHLGFFPSRPVADLFVLGELMYLATDEGLVVVALDCPG
jgi:hypothetical protein